MRAALLKVEGVDEVVVDYDKKTATCKTSKKMSTDKLLEHMPGKFTATVAGK